MGSDPRLTTESVVFYHCYFPPVHFGGGVLLLQITAVTVQRQHLWILRSQLPTAQGRGPGGPTGWVLVLALHLCISQTPDFHSPQLYSFHHIDLTMRMIVKSAGPLHLMKLHQS